MLANVHAKSEEMVALLHDRLPQTLQFGGNLFSSSIKKTGHSEIGFFFTFLLLSEYLFNNLSFRGRFESMWKNLKTKLVNCR